MTFEARKRVHVLPVLYATVHYRWPLRLRVTSWTWHAWRTSWNTHERRVRVNTPGPGGWKGRRR